MNDKMKKVLNVALKVVTGLLVAFTVFMMLFTVITVTTVDKNDRAIFGTRFYIVQTDSMSLSENNKDMDVHFNAGDIILIKDVPDKNALEPGDIIAFISMNDESLWETITHMIREVEKDKNGKVVGYVTFGTNTGTNDESLVEPRYVLGKYAGKLPGVGNFFAFVKSVPGYIVCILIPFLLLILYNGVDVIRLFRQYKKEQMDAMQAEKDQIEADRAETQRMMQELLALKAQLEQKNSAPAPAATAEAAVEKAEEPKEESKPAETAAPEKEEAPSEPEQETCEAEATEEPALEAEADLDEVVEEPVEEHIEESQEPKEADGEVNSEEEVANEPLSEEAPVEDSTEEPSEASEETESPEEEASDEN